MIKNDEPKRKTAETNKRKYGEDYYVKLGEMSAAAYKEQQKEGIAKPRGFAVNRELARLAGAKGGRISRRRKQS